MELVDHSTFFKSILKYLEVRIFSAFDLSQRASLNILLHFFLGLGLTF